MNCSQTLLTSLKASKGGISDYRVAKILGCSRSHISLIKNGARSMSEDMAIEVAKMSKLDPKYVLLSLMIEKSDSEEMRKILEEIKEDINHTKQ